LDQGRLVAVMKGGTLVVDGLDALGSEPRR
jgi:hypothetical protein